MGYTHYFELKSELTEDAIKDVKKVLEKYPWLVYEYDCDDPPVVTTELIRFNGAGDEGHETFYVEPYSSEFCKTAGKEYDLPACEVLLILKHYYGDKLELSSDGFWCNEEDYYTKTLGGYWNEALDNVGDEFGYKFTLHGVIEEERGRKYYKLEIV